MSSKAEKELLVKNELGIHARPAAMFVKIASSYSSEVMVEKDGEEINGKSIMGLMMLAAGKGSVITVRTEGEDAEEALEELGSLFEKKFGED